MRMIERWFPCAEVSEASAAGWGSAKSEKALFTWFAARPLAQARAAVLTSLLPWPDDPEEQHRLEEMVRTALAGRDSGHGVVVEELRRLYPSGATLLDSFSGRAIIPLEAARYQVQAWAIDYSPIATLAGMLLADYPLRDWSSEPPLPFAPQRFMEPNRLVEDVRMFLRHVGEEYERAMAEFYPRHGGKYPWGYLWAVSLPCQECGRRFPLTGSLVLRHPLKSKGDVGQSYYIDADRQSGEWQVVVHPGPPQHSPTLVARTKGGKAVRGKSAVCPFCDHAHPKEVHTRLAGEGLGRDELLLAADLDDQVGKSFRLPTAAERETAARAAEALSAEPPFAPGTPAVPDEVIPAGNNDTVRGSMYGARTYGDLANARQTLGFVRLARAIASARRRLVDGGVSEEYSAALCAFAGSVLVRKLKYSTRGATLRAHHHATSNRIQVDHIFSNEASLAYSYDYFETGLSDGPGSWDSVGSDTLAVLTNQLSRPPGRPAIVQRGSAAALPMRSGRLDAVVIDPPYDEMIDYADASDLFFAWLKRALSTTHAGLFFTSDQYGLQEKDEEIVVKRGGGSVGDHRTREHYDALISRSFAEAARVVKTDGVVSIVFGHGDPEVWHRLLAAIGGAGLVLTASWPARTERGGGAGDANIVTTLTLACRPAPAHRPDGRLHEVDAEVRKAVKERVPDWEAAGLALPDQLMASAGPAMEVVGRYAAVYDRQGEPVDSMRYLKLARRAVEEAADIRIEGLPLESFDARTRFALFWARLYGRGTAPKSEARWQALASDLQLPQLGGVITEADKGVRLAFGRESRRDVTETSTVIDVALALAAAWAEGPSAAGEVLARAGRDAEDESLWAALAYLSGKLPDGDPDGSAWTALVRNRKGVGRVARDRVIQHEREASRSRRQQLPLFEIEPARRRGQ